MNMSKEDILLDYKLAKSKKLQIGILADLNECSKEDIISILIEQGIDKKVIAMMMALRKPKHKKEESEMHDVENLVIEREEARAATKPMKNPKTEPPAVVETRKTAPVQPLEMLINGKAMELISGSVSGVMEYLDNMETLQTEMMFIRGVDSLRKELICAIKEHGA